jgi:NarL family two-component system response regulator LiaR
LQPDVILMDLLMPCKTGLEAITEIKEDNPQTRILVLTSFGEEDRVSDAIRAGALGFLIKDSSTEDLFHAIREVYADNLSLPPEIARRLMQNLQQPKHEQSPVDVLTKREVDVLQAVARGLANREIAEKLAINEATVRSHVSNLLDKLGLSNRTQAALYAIDAGLVDHD